MRGDSTKSRQGMLNRLALPLFGVALLSGCGGGVSNVDELGPTSTPTTNSSPFETSEDMETTPTQGSESPSPEVEGAEVQSELPPGISPEDFKTMTDAIEADFVSTCQNFVSSGDAYLMALSGVASEMGGSSSDWQELLGEWLLQNC